MDDITVIRRDLLVPFPCYSMKKMSTISTNSGKLFSLGTIESSNVASTTFVEFLIDTPSNNDGARGARTTRSHDAVNATEQL